MIPAIWIMFTALAPPEQRLFVVFGRPGSGKSTIADAAAGLLTEEGRSILRLDLDICVRKARSLM
jgi:Mrp family chromosome partitioning ATPase